MHLPIGTFLKNGDYRIEKILGQGGFGITYLAEQISLGRKVAVKEFFMQEHCNRSDGSSDVSIGSLGSRRLVERFRQKFIKEARMIATFHNVHIISIYDVFEENNTAYYVMEYVDGGSLADKVSVNGPLCEETAISYVRQIADALAEVHSRNLLHLDIKPANVMFNGRGEVVLIDFGVSKHYDEGGFQTSSAAIGTSEGYAPLEQYESGALDSFTPATDIYALGATLFYMLTAQHPPKAGDVMNDGLPVLSEGFSAAIYDVIVAAMQPRRKERPQCVKDFLVLLDDAENEIVPLHVDVVDQDSLSVSKNELHGDNVGEDGKEPAKRKNKLGCIIPILLLICFVAGVYIWLSERGNEVKPDSKKEKIISNAKPDIPDEDVLEVSVEEDSFEPSHGSLSSDSLLVADTIQNVPTGREGWGDLWAIDTMDIVKNEINGHEYVDMGLPSGLKWATCNVGAESPEQSGKYYAWGEVAPKTRYSKDNSKLSKGADYSDVASVEWKGSWRLPTKNELDELLNEKYCRWQWVKQNGVSGYKVTSKNNGNTIFFPASGYYKGTQLKDKSAFGAYWSSNRSDGNSDGAYGLSLKKDVKPFTSWFYTSNGLPVRPVSE